MKTLVVYDSYFGNTQKVAEEIGKELGEKTEVIDVKIFDFEKVNEVDLIFIGSPTRAFSPTKPINKLVKMISKNKKSLKVACFDTRIRITDKLPKILIRMAKRFGYATDTMIKMLSKNKFVELQKPNWFYVEDNEGPILEEELIKARNWAIDIIK